MNENLDEWDDERARELYLTVCNSGVSNKRTKAISGLGKLAKDGSANAAYALRLIARSSVSSLDRELSLKELEKV